MQKTIEYLKQNINLVLIVLLILAGFSLYINTFHNQMFWDDNDFILNNQFVKNFDLPKIISQNVIAGAGIVSNYWRPVLSTMFAFEWQLWHGHVFGWHLVNTLFHIANAILLFFILLKLFDKRLLAFLTSLIFLIHPLQTEAVSYVNSLGDSLSVFFMFSGMFMYVKFLKKQNPKHDRNPYILSLIFYALALMSKETAFIMPALLILAEFILSPLLSSRARPSAEVRLFGVKIFKNIWPHLVLAGLYILLRATALNFKNTFNLYDQQNIFTTHIWIRVITFFKIIITYISLLFYPHNLHMERSLDPATSLSLPVIAGGIIFLALTYFALFKFKKYPIVSFGILWFFICLIPTSNILIPINGLLYEHWLYLPMVGFWVALFSVVERVAEVFRPPWKPEGFRYVGLALFTFYLLLFTSTTLTRNREWHDPITFYNQTLQYAPTSYRVINNLGMAYADTNQTQLAIQTYNRALALDSTNPVAFHNLANAYKSLNQADLAIENYKKAIQLDPYFSFSYGALVNLYIDLGQKDEAQKLYDQYQTLFTAR